MAAMKVAVGGMISHVEIRRPGWSTALSYRLLRLAAVGCISETWAVEVAAKLLYRFTRYRVNGGRWRRLPAASVMLYWHCGVCRHPNGKWQRDCMVCASPRGLGGAWIISWEREP